MSLSKISTGSQRSTCEISTGGCPGCNFQLEGKCPLVHFYIFSSGRGVGGKCPVGGGGGANVRIPHTFSNEDPREEDFKRDFHDR